MATSGGTEPQFEIAADVPLVGRERERAVLTGALREAKEGKGSTWIIQGPGGMGKTALVRWLQEYAEKSGFGAHWGFGLKEVSTPFFPIDQMFRSLNSASPTAVRPTLPSPLPTVVVFEEERPEAVFEEVLELTHGHPTLLIGRDRGAQLRERREGLDPSATVLRLSRDGASDSLHPADVEAVGRRAIEHLEHFPRGLVVLTGLEYLISQTEFPAVLRFLQFLRDAAEESGGHVFLSLNPRSLEPRQATLLMAEGEVVRTTPTTGVGAPRPTDSPTSVMIWYLDTLERASSRVPLLLLIDDVQWTDPASLRAFQLLARNLRPLRVMLVATYRTDDVQAPDEQKERVLKEVLATAEKEGILNRMDLGGLDTEKALALASSLLGHPVEVATDEPGFQELMRRSEGNPYFLKESLRSLAEEGFVQRSGDHFLLHLGTAGPAAPSPRPVIPPTLQRLVQRRLERLAPAEREVLEWASVAGSVFDQSPLEGLLPSGPVPLTQIIGALEHREHLIEQQAPGRWSFGHPLVWEVTQLELAPEVRMKRAARLADWWAERRPDDLDTISRLYHEARLASQGEPWIRRALRHAIKSNALEAVERYHAWLQELLESRHASLEERVELGLQTLDAMSEAVGNSAEAVQIARGLLAMKPSQAQTRAVEAYLALNIWMIAPRESRSLSARALELSGPGSATDTRTQAVAMLASTNQYAGEGRFADAERLALQVVALGKGVPAWVLVRAHYRVGVMLSRRGAPEEAREQLRQAERWAETTGVPMLVAYCHNLACFIAEVNGEVREYRKAIEAALAVVRTAGAPIYLCLANLDMARAWVREGDLEKARLCLTELQKVAERFRLERSLRVSVPHLQAMISLRAGRAKEAVEPLESALQWMDEVGDREVQAELQLLLAEALLEVGELDRGSAMAQQVLEEAKELDRCNAPLPWLIQGRVLAARGDAAGARQKFEKAGEISLHPPNLLNQGFVATHLARWEEAFGDPSKVETLREQAKGFFDRSGVQPEAWARAYPPPVVRPES